MLLSSPLYVCGSNCRCAQAKALPARGLMRPTLALRLLLRLVLRLVLHLRSCGKLWLTCLALPATPHAVRYSPSAWHCRLLRLH